MLRRINDALPGLVAGIILWGVLVQLSGVWFVEEKLHYSVGLWFGVAVAIGMAINMATMIYDSVLEDVGNRANYRVVAKSIFRYLVVVILFFILGYFNFGNLFTAFLGMMGLKVSAYSQPLLEKAQGRLFGRSDASSEDEVFKNE